MAQSIAQMPSQEVPGSNPGQIRTWFCFTERGGSVERFYFTWHASDGGRLPGGALELLQEERTSFHSGYQTAGRQARDFLMIKRFCVQ